VVREAQVDAAGVQVDPLAEQVQRHGRALDVPAGEADAPRRVPGHLAGRAGLLPQRPVGVEPLALADVGRLEPVARTQVLEPVAGQLPYPS
jgi:hypothetical protein